MKSIVRFLITYPNMKNGNDIRKESIGTKVFILNAHNRATKTTQILLNRIRFRDLNSTKEESTWIKNNTKKNHIGSQDGIKDPVLYPKPISIGIPLE